MQDLFPIATALGKEYKKQEDLRYMKVLVINAGSSSLKYQLIDMDTESVLAKGNCERIGMGRRGFSAIRPLTAGR